MLSYYFNVAVRGLARDAVLSALIVAAIGLGIGASMTVVAMFRATSGDPIPEKSTQLWAPQIDSWGPDKHSASSSERADGLQDQLTYIDAMALQRAHAAKRQAAMYRVSLTAIPADGKSPPFIVEARATYADFFPMFNVPFQYGAPWRSEDDAHKCCGSRHLRRHERQAFPRSQQRRKDHYARRGRLPDCRRPAGLASPRRGSTI